jgi:hypothetical protein
MIKNNKFISVVFTAFICFIALISLVIVRDHFIPEEKSIPLLMSNVVSPVNLDPIMINPPAGEPTPTESVFAKVSKLSSQKVDLPETNTIENNIYFVDSPVELVEGSPATFTWAVSGPPRTIGITTVYFGTKSSPGTLSKTVTPGNAGYTFLLKDFLEGEYSIPLQFVGSISIPTPGTYYCRAYTLIDGDQIWSDERMFTVKPIPKNEIRIIDPPVEANRGSNVPFTWEITGPATTTTFTTVLLGKTSKSGQLETTVDIPQTPYTIMVKDFTNGNYNVPLRFIGNTTLNETGDYYFRALVLINNKNIWSDEYKLTVR